jgi:nucleoside-triphosphatase THEP1
MITILTGPVKSGKTQELFKFCLRKQNADGILQPVVNGKRCLYFIGSKQLIPLEMECDDEIVLGDYHFSPAAFIKANKYLNSLIEQSPDLLIIDEIGQLELAGKGMEPAVSKIISLFNSQPTEKKLLLVIREKMLERAIQHYSLQKEKIQIITQLF